VQKGALRFGDFVAAHDIGLLSEPRWNVHRRRRIVPAATTSTATTPALRERLVSVFSPGMRLLIIGMLAFAIYNTHLLGRYGATVGKRRMHLKCVNDSGQPIGFWMALLRGILKSLQAAFCLLLLLWPLWDKKKQGLHDKVVGTNVYPA